MPWLMIKSASFLISMLAFCTQQSWCSSAVSHWERWGRGCVKSEPKFPFCFEVWSSSPESAAPGNPTASPIPQTKVSSGFHLIHLTLPLLSAHSHGFYPHLKTTRSHRPACSRGHWEGSLWFQQILNPRDDTIKLGVNWLCLFPSIFYTQWMILQIKDIFLPFFTQLWTGRDMRKADSNTTASVLQHKLSVFYFIHLFLPTLSTTV